jgi:hypothetical protein
VADFAFFSNLLVHLLKDCAKLRLFTCLLLGGPRSGPTTALWLFPVMNSLHGASGD